MVRLLYLICAVIMKQCNNEKEGGVACLNRQAKYNYMKLCIEYKEAERINKVMSLLGSEKDAVVNFLTGVKPQGNMFFNVFRITTASEQLEGRFFGMFEGEEVKAEFAAYLSQFLSILSSILSYKQNIYIEFADGLLFLGVGDDIHIPINVVKDSMEPIKMKGGEMAYQLTIGSKAFDELVAKAFYFVEPNGNEGFANAILRFNMVSGELRGYSSNGKGIATSAMQTITLRQSIDPKSPTAEQAKAVADAMDKVLNVYCSLEEGFSPEKYCVALPLKAVNNIRLLANMGEVFGMSGDEHHLFVMSSDELTVYTCTKAAGFHRAIFMIDDETTEQTAIRLMVDTSQLKRGFQLIDKIMVVNRYEQTPVQVKVTEKELELRINKMTNGVVKIPLIEQEGAGMYPEKEWYLNTKIAMLPINSLNQGNALLYLPDETGKPIFIGNGELADGLTSSFAMFLQVR